MRNKVGQGVLHAPMPCKIQSTPYSHNAKQFKDIHEPNVHRRSSDTETSITQPQQ